MGCSGGEEYRDWWLNWYTPRMGEFFLQDITNTANFLHGWRPLPSNKQKDAFSLSVGIHLSGGVGAYGDAGAYLFGVDTSGDMHLLQSYVGGGGTTTAMGEATPVIFITHTSLDDISGWSVNVGGSAESGISAGADVVIFKDSDGNKHWGIQLSLPGWGVGFPLHLEFHGGASYTFSPAWGLKNYSQNH